MVFLTELLALCILENFRSNSLQGLKKQNQIYVPMPGKFFLAILCILVFLVTFIMNFPMQKNVSKTLATALRSVPGCPITFSKSQLNYFPPGVEFSGFNLPARCFSGRTSMNLDKLKLNVAGFDWLLFAPVFSFNTTYQRSKLVGLAAVTKGNQQLKLENSIIRLQDFKGFLPAGFDIQGDIKISTLVELTNGKIFNLNLNASSKNFKTGPSAISILQLPGLNIGNLQLRASTPTAKKLIVKDFILGDPAKPIHGFFKGSLGLNGKNMKSSKLDLNGQFKLSDALLDELAIVSTFLTSYKKDDGYYHLKLGGTLGAPKPSKAP